MPDVWTATKTGTTTTSNSAVTKDSLIASYSTALATFVWNGNHDGAGLSSNSNAVVRNTVGTFMERVHKEVYEPEGKWHYGDQPAMPAGMQTLTVNGQTDIWPSWFSATKNSGVSKETVAFNRYNHLLATECTAEAYKVEVEVTKVTDPMTGKDTITAPEPYNYDTTDTCDYNPPTVALRVSGSTIYATVRKGSYDITGMTLTVTSGDTSTDYNNISIASSGAISGYTINGTESAIKLTISDASGYSDSATVTLTPTSTSASTGSGTNRTKPGGN